MKSGLRGWSVLVRERFSPLSYTSLIAVFLLAHQASLSAAESSRESIFRPADLGRGLLLFAGLLLFFFKLRLYDELKDLEVDARFNPDRPLVRGVLTPRDLHLGIAVCIALESILFAGLGLQALAAAAVAIAYSLLMFGEFFIPRLIRPRLTTYAVCHTAVSVLLSLTVSAALYARWPWSLGPGAYYLALDSWCLFNLFEFGRKTFSSGEERPGVDSYSSLFGRFGAIGLAMSMVCCSAVLLHCMESPAAPHLLTFSLLAGASLGVLALVYAIADRPPFGALYRQCSSLYIVLHFLGYATITRLAGQV